MKKIVFALLLVVCILFGGTFGYMLLEGWGLFDAFYMTIITISTVGFHEVASLGKDGRIFTVILIVLGIGVGGYTIGQITSFIVEGNIRNIFKGRRMEKEIALLSNHVIVCGYGRTGAEIVETLRNNRKRFVIIDKDESTVLELQGKGFVALADDATDDDVLRKAGVENAFCLITALGNDADNVYVVLTARGINPKLRIIARAVDQSSSKKLIRAGADKVVSPFEIAGRRMAYLATNPDIVEFLEVMTRSSDIELKIDQVTIGEKSRLKDSKLNQSDIRSLTGGAMVIGIKKRSDGRMIVNPPGETLLEEEDILVVLSNDIQLEKLQEFV